MSTLALEHPWTLSSLLPMVVCTKRRLVGLHSARVPRLGATRTSCRKIDDLSNHPSVASVSYPSSEMLSHEEAPAMQPSADECPAAGQCQFLAGRLRAAADCDAAWGRDVQCEQSSLAYCVLARRKEGAGGRAPCHGRGTLQYTGLVLIFTRSLQ